MEVMVKKNCDCPGECSAPVLVPIRDERTGDDGYTVECNNCHAPYKIVLI